jgi:hypothetical protein
MTNRKWDPLAGLRQRVATAQARNPHRRLTHDPDTPISADPDQGLQSTPPNPPATHGINTIIRRAAGLPIRPGQRPTPEVGDYPTSRRT